MDFTCIFFGVLFTIAGFLFACGKGHIHLSAWKNMSRKRKIKLKLSRFAVTSGKSLYSMALSF